MVVHGRLAPGKASLAQNTAGRSRGVFGLFSTLQPAETDRLSSGPTEAGVSPYDVGFRVVGRHQPLHCPPLLYIPLSLKSFPSACCCLGPSSLFSKKHARVRSKHTNAFPPTGDFVIALEKSRVQYLCEEEPGKPPTTVTDTHLTNHPCGQVMRFPGVCSVSYSNVTHDFTEGGAWPTGSVTQNTPETLPLYQTTDGGRAPSLPPLPHTHIFSRVVTNKSIFRIQKQRPGKLFAGGRWPGVIRTHPRLHLKRRFHYSSRRKTIYTSIFYIHSTQS